MGWKLFQNPSVPENTSIILSIWRFSLSCFGYWEVFCLDFAVVSQVCGGEPYLKSLDKCAVISLLGAWVISVPCSPSLPQFLMAEITSAIHFNGAFPGQSQLLWDRCKLEWFVMLSVWWTLLRHFTDCSGCSPTVPLLVPSKQWAQFHYSLKMRLKFSYGLDTFSLFF